MSQAGMAIYPGSFDPITNGHVDIVLRARAIFDKVVIAILENPQKRPLFDVNERRTMIEKIFQNDPAIEIDTFQGLLVDYVRSRGARVIIRGLRAVTDFEYEFQMALMNRRLCSDIETVFLMAAESYSYVSSRLVKEIFFFGGDVKGLVPPVVLEYLKAKKKQKP